MTQKEIETKAEEMIDIAQKAKIDYLIKEKYLLIFLSSLSAEEKETLRKDETIDEALKSLDI